MNEFGIVIGSSDSCEWMLKWWWHHYRLHNDFPVALADFGLSIGAKKWARDQGMKLINPNSNILVADEHTINTSHKATWSQAYAGDVWEARKHWFQKPFAIAASPFPTTLWLDLDCEVKADLSTLFQLFLSPFEIALAHEPLQSQAQASALGFTQSCQYNSGVILIRKETAILKDWIREVQLNNHLHMGDQNALTHVVENQASKVLTLPSIYNWRLIQGNNPNAVIIHHVGEHGKLRILQDSSYKPSTNPKKKEL